MLRLGLCRCDIRVKVSPATVLDGTDVDLRHQTELGNSAAETKKLTFILVAIWRSSTISENNSWRAGESWACVCEFE